MVSKGDKVEEGSALQWLKACLGCHSNKALDGRLKYRCTAATTNFSSCLTTKPVGEEIVVILIRDGLTSSTCCMLEECRHSRLLGLV